MRVETLVTLGFPLRHGGLVTDSSPVSYPLLIVTGGPLDGTSLEVREPYIERLLGSGADCHLRLQLGNIDPLHARAVWTVRGFILSDAGSTTGTYVNGERISADHPLSAGDRIFLGPPGSKASAKLLVLLPPATAAQPSEPLAPSEPPAPSAPPSTSAPHSISVYEPILLEEEPISLEPIPEMRLKPVAPPAPAAPPPAPAPTAPSAPVLPPSGDAPTPADAAALWLRSTTKGPHAASAEGAKPRPDYSEAPSIAVDRPREALAVPPVEGPRPALTPLTLLQKVQSTVPRPVLIGTAAALAGLSLWGAFRAAQRPAPLLVSIMPGRVEPGQTVTLTGTGFEPDPTRNTVRFGDQKGTITSSSDKQLVVSVPEGLSGSECRVQMVARGSASNSLFLMIYIAPRIQSFEPDVALPGAEIVIRGRNLGPSPSVQIAGSSAVVLDAQPTALRVRVPEIQVLEGRSVPVSIQVGNEGARSTALILGRLPLVTEVIPGRGDPGEHVIVHGRGFDTNPEGNVVSFGGRRTLVLSAAPTELTALVPGAGTLDSQIETRVVIQTRGSTSSPAPFVVTHPSAATFLPRYFAAPVLEHPNHDHVFVSTELGPVLLLSGKAQSSSTAERADRVASALNEAVQAANTRPLTFELRDKPEPGVAVAGDPGLLVSATSEDAAGYDEPWDPSTRGRRSTPKGLATYWTALLSDQLSLFVRRERPLHLLELTPRGRIFSEIYREGVRRVGPEAGIPTSALNPMPPNFAKRLWEVALLPSLEGTSGAGIVEGRWDGTMQDGGGEKTIQVRFRADGSRLTGSLTTTSGGLAMDLPLQAITYERGSLRFTLLSGGSPRHFAGVVNGSSITGTIQLDAGSKDAAGRFSLRFAE